MSLTLFTAILIIFAVILQITIHTIGLFGMANIPTVIYQKMMRVTPHISVYKPV